MGRHYFNMYYDPDQPCTPDNIPGKPFSQKKSNFCSFKGFVTFLFCLVQLVFSGGVLNGFVWQHVSTIPGDRWESVNSFGISNIVDRPPNCLYDLVESPGVTTMHVSLFLKYDTKKISIKLCSNFFFQMYLRNYETLCISDKNL